MIRTARLLASAFVVFVGTGLAILFPASPLAAQKKAVSAGEGKERLTPEKDWSKASEGAEAKLFQALKKGEQPVRGNEAVLDHGAQWYAYRLTHSEFQEPRPGVREMHMVVKEALDQILDPKDTRKRPNANQIAYIDEFGKRFSARLHEVVKNPKVIARLNAAIVLARLAGTGQEDAAQVLVEVIQDPKENSAVKYHALRGLKELFAWGRGESPFKPGEKEKEANVVRALLDYVRQEQPLPKDATPDEIAAINWVRSEAVAALGYTRLPARCQTVKGKMVTDQPTALELLRVMRKDKDGFKGVEPNIVEQLTAAIAICQLQHKQCDDYEPDYAAYHIGGFLLEFAAGYNNDGAQKKQPWKIYAARLTKALNDFSNDLAEARHPASAYVTKLVEQASGMLSAIEAGSGNIDTGYVNKLDTWLQQNPPKNTTVYKSLQDSVIKPAEKAAE